MILNKVNLFSVAGMLHLANDEPLFRRIACLGGQNIVMQPLDPAVHEQFYACAVHELGLDGLSPEKRIKAFQEIEPERLKGLTSIPSRPVIDHDICCETATFAGIEHGFPQSLHKGWCEEIMIGDCEFDVCESEILFVATYEPANDVQGLDICWCYRSKR